MSSDNLIENNIFQHIATPLQNEDSLGTVQAYNFTLDDYYTKGGAYAWQQGSAYHHGAGDQYHLFEGNQGIGLSADAIHGTADFITAFRNYWTGLDAAPGGSTIKTQQTTPVILQAYSRYYNIIGNVLGTSTYHTNYSCASLRQADSCSSNADHSIYALGFSGNEGTHGSLNNDPNVSASQPGTVGSLMRWGNYDLANGTNPQSTNDP